MIGEIHASLAGGGTGRRACHFAWRARDVPGSDQKKGPVVADRALKFWERMPERQALNGPRAEFVQVRKTRLLLRFSQLTKN
ncbi:MAG: hypothetical protein KGK11_04090 [Sphingomonadales bacterium]|nr:hypothetical protein [Sphingomonadales bacterium]